MKQPIRFSVLTVSDRCASGERDDLGGPAVVKAMVELCSAKLCDVAIVPDEIPQIIDGLRVWLDASDAPDLILTTGGTGLATRDVTPEATLQLLERRHDGLLELARRRCYDITPMTYLSRGVSGTAGQTLIINLPGSSRGAHEMVEAISDILPHAIETLRDEVGDNHPSRPKQTGVISDDHASE